MSPSVSAAIVAGGKAKRFGGQVKSLIEVDGEAIIDRQLRVLRERFHDIVIAANHRLPFEHLGLDIVPDEVAGKGPLAGIAAALSQARSDFVFVVAGDMPNLDVRAIDALLERLTGNVDVVIPFVGGHAEPLFACYSRRSLEVVRRRLERGELRAQALIDDPDLVVARVDERVLLAIDPGLGFLANLNSQADLR